MSEQTQLDQYFSSRGKRSRPPPMSTEDDFEQIFQLGTTNKRRRVTNTTEQTGSLKKKRSSFTDDQETAEIEEVFSTTNRRKARRKDDPPPIDLLDMFQTKSKDLFTPTMTTKKKTTTDVKLFFDDTDVKALREEEDHEQKTMGTEYIPIKPVLITGGQWLSKEVESKSLCETTVSTSDDQRNLMNVQYLPLTVDQPRTKAKKSASSLLDGKSFHKQLILSDSDILRKENLQSCYNALLEEINKGRLPSTISKPRDADEQCDFFDLPLRKKKF